MVLCNGVYKSSSFRDIALWAYWGLSLTFQGRVTSSVTWPFDSPYAISYWLSFGTKPLSLTVAEIFNVECYAIDMTLIRTLNEGQGHSFWYQSISQIRLSLNSNFCFRTHRLATIHSVQTDDRVQTTDGVTDATVPCATVLVRSAKNGWSKDMQCIAYRIYNVYVHIRAFF